MGKQGLDRGSSQPRVSQQMCLNIHCGNYIHSLPATLPSTLFLCSWNPGSFPWYHLGPTPEMSTSRRRERDACHSSGACVRKGSTSALLSCAPGAKGRQAGRPCTLFMARPPPRTVNRGAGSWHRSSLRSEGPLWQTPAHF